MGIKTKSKSENKPILSNPLISKANPLTDRQQEVFEFIKHSLETVNRPPTVREIGLKFNITSTNGVRSILSALIKKNYIKRIPKLSRGLDLVESKTSQSIMSAKILDFKKAQILSKKKRDSLNSESSNTISIPILGRVAAGTPILAVENLEGTVSVDKDFLMRQTDVIALRVQGQSMKDAGIFNGDLVFARTQKQAEKGQMVVAIIGEEATVKYFHPEKDFIRLEPANEAFRSIIVDKNLSDFRIAGRVIGVMRQYN